MRYKSALRPNQKSATLVVGAAFLLAVIVVLILVFT
jgi:hypothetical protein